MQTYFVQEWNRKKHVQRPRRAMIDLFVLAFSVGKKQNASTCTTWKKAWPRFKCSTLQLLSFRLSPSIHLAAASGKVFIVSISFRPKMTQVRSKNLSTCSWHLLTMLCSWLCPSLTFQVPSPFSVAFPSQACLPRSLRVGRILEAARLLAAKNRRCWEGWRCSSPPRCC